MVQVLGSASVSQGVVAMFPAANRAPPPPHGQHAAAAMMGQQGHAAAAAAAAAGYLGYYPTQPSHHYQYPPPPPPDFNCNLQPFMSSQFTDGLQTTAPPPPPPPPPPQAAAAAAWHNPVYMGGHHHHHHHAAAAAAVHHHHAAAVQHCQQRSPATYDDWMTPLHHNGGGGASPLSQHTGGLIGTGGLHQPPHTPSPCAPGGGGGAQTQPAGPPSPNFTTGASFPKVGAHLEYGSDGGVSGGAQSPNEAVLGLGGGGESVGDADSSPDTHAPNTHPTPPNTHHTHPPPSSRPQQIRSPFRWIEKTAFQGPPHTDGAFLDLDGLPVKGKTRTKDKYRVVYSDHQRLELEKEFHYSRYITIRRKSELASMLGLSERQVKIWFQNRRAKERKQMKKRDEIHNKEKLEVVGGGMGGVQQYHPQSVTPIPPPPPMHPHVTSHHHNHHHHHHHHHQTPAGKPIITMDIKPPIGMD